MPLGARASSLPGHFLAPAPGRRGRLLEPLEIEFCLKRQRLKAPIAEVTGLLHELFVQAQTTLPLRASTASAAGSARLWKASGLLTNTKRMSPPCCVRICSSVLCTRRQNGPVVADLDDRDIKLAARRGEGR